MEALQKAFERMPNNFSSKMFLKAAREFGYPENLIKSHDNLDFMRARARQAKFRSKTWEKFPEYQKKGNVVLPLITKPDPQISKPTAETIYNIASRLLEENHQLKLQIIELEHANKMRELLTRS